jgi:hypothetical protein
VTLEFATSNNCLGSVTPVLAASKEPPRLVILLLVAPTTPWAASAALASSYICHCQRTLQFLSLVGCRNQGLVCRSQGLVCRLQQSFKLDVSHVGANNGFAIARETLSALIVESWAITIAIADLICFQPLCNQ